MNNSTRTNPHATAFNGRAVAGLMVVALMLLVSTTSSASVFPLRAVDGQWFATTEDRLQVMGVRMDATPSFQQDSAIGGRHAWDVEVELWVRNVSGDSATFHFGLLDAGPIAETSVHVRGAPTGVDVRTIRHDPAFAWLRGGEMPVFGVEIEDLEMVSINVRTVVLAETDSLGQSVLRWPANAMRLFGGVIQSASISVRLPERPVGLLTSMRRHTFYDEPVNELTFFAIDWDPTTPFEVAWLGTWSALVLIAEIEDCPQPWAIVRGVMAGDFARVRAALDDVDEPTLDFCMSLPLITHGFVFSSEQTRRNLRAMTLNRYVGGRTDRGSVYRENPTFREEELSQPERVYRNALRQELESR